MILSVPFPLRSVRETGPDAGRAEPQPWRPYERPYGMADETDQKLPQSLDPQTPLDRLVRKWALVAVVWLIVGTIARLKGDDLSVGLIVCLVFFVIGAARLR